MQTSNRLPPHFRWTPAQLTDAVPLRLSELFAFTADDATACANASRHRVRPASSYLPADALPPRFRIS